jgi:hypothetical protein
MGVSPWKFILLRVDGNKFCQSNWVVHLVWCLGVLWSPESAFYVTFVLWPYYLLIQYQGCTQKKLITVILKASATLMSLLVLLISVFTMTYYAIYKVFPSAEAYAVYALYPPGPMPVSSKGTAWFFLAVMALGVMLLVNEFRRNSSGKETHYLFITMLMTYSVSSYFFLGRSHSNNILNLTPIITLFLVVIYSVCRTDMYRVSASILLVSLISYSAFFGWHSMITSYTKGSLLQFNAKQLISDLSNKRNSVLQEEIEDVNKAVKFIKMHFQEPVLVMNENYSLIPNITDEVWSAYHGFANFAYVPVKQRRIFLHNTMVRLQKTGWIIAKKGDVSKPWLEDYDFIYTRDRTIDFGSYYAVRYVPKNDL